MKINLAKAAGFCPGVKNADKAIREALQINDARICTLGKLIHNRVYNEELGSLCVKTLEIDEVETEILRVPNKKMILFIRTHGVPRWISERLERLTKLYPRGV